MRNPPLLLPAYSRRGFLTCVGLRPVTKRNDKTTLVGLGVVGVVGNVPQKAVAPEAMAYARSTVGYGNGACRYARVLERTAAVSAVPIPDK